tara:strand:+ start:1278 stop:1673 length:396 start_codon:yes stop_codon:yes gene_type:complete
MIPKITDIHLMMERADFQYIAQQLVKWYRVRSKVKFNVRGNAEGDYDFDNDTINLRKSYPSVKEFIVSVLHEIHHAKQVKKYGKKKFLKKYIQAGDMANWDGFDRYDNNKWEKKAENWANQEYNRRWKNKF